MNIRTRNRLTAIQHATLALIMNDRSSDPVVFRMLKCVPMMPPRTPSTPPTIPPINAVSIIFNFLAERKAHPPLGAVADVDHGVEVIIIINHRNRTASSGWMVRLVLPLSYLLRLAGLVAEGGFFQNLPFETHQVSKIPR